MSGHSLSYASKFECTPRRYEPISCPKSNVRVTLCITHSVKFLASRREFTKAKTIVATHQVIHIMELTSEYYTDVDSYFQLLETLLVQPSPHLNSRHEHTWIDAVTARSGHVKLVTWPDKEVDVLHKVCSLVRKVLLLVKYSMNVLTRASRNIQDNERWQVQTSSEGHKNQAGAIGAAAFSGFKDTIFIAKLASPPSKPPLVHFQFRVLWLSKW